MLHLLSKTRRCNICHTESSFFRIKGFLWLLWAKFFAYLLFIFSRNSVGVSPNVSR